MSTLGIVFGLVAIAAALWSVSNAVLAVNDSIKTLIDILKK